MTTLFPGNESAAQVLAPAKRRSLVPLLTVLFLLSYGLMTLLIVFQGSTIQSQRSLILSLLDDSRQLWAAKGKALQEKQPVHGPSKAPSAQAPSTQVAPQHRNQQRAGKASKPQGRNPSEPAADLVDQRRMLNLI